MKESTVLEMREQGATLLSTGHPGPFSVVRSGPSYSKLIVSGSFKYIILLTALLRKSTL